MTAMNLESEYHQSILQDIQADLAELVNYFYVSDEILTKQQIKNRILDYLKNN